MTCSPEEHSWRVRAGDFTFVGHREGGGIANRVRRVCETCPAYSEQTEVSWPSSCRHLVEDVREFDGPPPRVGRDFQNGDTK